MGCSWGKAYREAEETGADVLETYDAALQADWGISLDEIEEIVQGPGKAKAPLSEG